MITLLLIVSNIMFASARPGTVQTRDGKQVQGDLTFTNGAVQISNQVEVAAIPHGEIARVSFTAETTAADGSAGTPRPTSKGQGLGLLGYYFANTNVNGPVQVRIDPVIDLDWATGEPIEGVGKDYFAVIWMGYLEAPASGEFTFALSADDQARLQIGPDFVVESRHEESTGTLALEARNRYPVTLLYRDNVGVARVRLSWSGPEFAKSPIPADRLYPASFVTEHRAEIQSARGLLATTFEKPDFSGTTSTEVTPASASTAGTNATRWTGQVRANHPETYTFYVATDGPVRLYVNGKALIDSWSRHELAEGKGTIRLAAGEFYDVRLESLGAARLFWSSPSQSKSAIPEANLLPFKRDTAKLTPTGANPLLPAGVLLRNGTFIACRVESIEEDRVQCSRLLEGKSIPLHEVARILCQPVPRALTGRVSPGRAGVLLANGDFVEGEFVGMEGTHVTISSVLLGLRTYDTTRQALAVIIREAEGHAPPCEIQLRDQSVLFAGDVELQPGAVVLRGDLLAGVRIDENELQLVKLR
jgi:PA14 domain-containing protein